MREKARLLSCYDGTSLKVGIEAFSNKEHEGFGVGIHEGKPAVVRRV